jgi:hypothetical protein
MRISVLFKALIQEFCSSSVGTIQSCEGSNLADSSFSWFITCWLCDWSTVTKSKANNYAKNTYVRPCRNKSENMTEPWVSRYRLLRHGLQTGRITNSHSLVRCSHFQNEGLHLVLEKMFKTDLRCIKRRIWVLQDKTVPVSNTCLTKYLYFEPTFNNVHKPKYRRVQKPTSFVSYLNSQRPTRPELCPRGAFVQPMLLWKSNRYYIFRVSVCSLI